MLCQLLQHHPQGLSTQDCLWSEGSQLLSGAKASSLLLPFCWAQLPLTRIQQLSKEPAAPRQGFQLTSGKDHPWSNSCPVGITAEVRKMRRITPAKPPVRKQSSCLTCKQGAGAPLIYMCADRWSDLTYSLQIPLSLKKVAGSYQPQGSKWFLINQPPLASQPLLTAAGGVCFPDVSYLSIWQVLSSLPR